MKPQRTQVQNCVVSNPNESIKMTSVGWFESKFLSDFEYKLLLITTYMRTINPFFTFKSSNAGKPLWWMRDYIFFNKLHSWQLSKEKRLITGVRREMSTYLLSQTLTAALTSFFLIFGEQYNTKYGVVNVHTLRKINM